MSGFKINIKHPRKFSGIKQRIFFLFFLFLSTGSLAQSLTELKKQKEKTAEEIEYINNLLKETNQNVKISLSRLSVLEKQITLQDKLINNITNEIDYIDNSIKTGSKRIDSLNQQLNTVKNNYANLIRYARRNQNFNNQLLFLLSADNFNQAYKRFVYLKQIADYRRKQAERISEITHSLNEQVADFNSKKEAKQNLLVSKIDQTRKIEEQKVKQKEYYSNLQQKEKELKKKLENQRKAEARLQSEIERVIEEEARKAAARKIAKEPKSVAINKEEKALSGDFSSNRGSFPWPVANGLITDHFGEHPHPVLKYVKVRNSGIDITTRSNEKARAIFKGEVSKVISIGGGNLAVIIRHGNYLTVYSNLVEVYVKAGQKIEEKQEIGKIYTDVDDDNKTILKFQLWHENTKLDPEEWIQRK
jgi:septal ring factor EnvC (AmiA/AmiB activator)